MHQLFHFSSKLRYECPGKCSFVFLSYVPEKGEITAFFNFFPPLWLLGRKTNFKGELEQISKKEKTVVFFYYTMSQNVDILFPRADLFPLGVD